MASIDALINWFQVRKGKVTYSMSRRNGPNSYDCSSAVYYALIEAGFLPKGTAIGNTESLYRLESKLLIPINRAEAKRGGIFVAGVKGASSGAYGHTGVFTNNSTIIHCNGGDNGISETPFVGRTGTPVYCYRLKGTDSSTSPSTDKHVVAKGDTLWGIATKYGMTVTTLKSLNGLNSDLIKPGQVLKISGSAAAKKVGDMVTLQTYASHYQTGQKIAAHVKGKRYKIVQVKSVSQSNSRYAYLLDGIMSWVLEQDVK